MKNLVLMTFWFAAFSVGGSGQNSKIESIYTNLASNYCQKLNAGKDDLVLHRGRCPGVGGYKIILEETSAGNQFLTLLTPAAQELELSFNPGTAPSNLGSEIEWRARPDGEKMDPLALIIPVYVFDNPKNSKKARTYLIVAKISGESACVTDVVKPIVKNQPVQARQMADLSAGKACQAMPPSQKQIRREIDDFVTRVDQNFEALKKEFTVREKRKNKRFLVEEAEFNIRKGELLTRNFSYTMNKQGLERLTVHYQVGTVSAKENYYYRNRKLVYVTEEHFFRHEGEVNSVWTAVHYFSKGILFHLSTNGHGKSETDDWDPDSEVPRMSRTRIKQLNQFLAQKKEQEKK